jgi:hypothetical protein
MDYKTEIAKTDEYVLQDLVHTLTGMMDGNVVQFYNLTAGSNV